MLIIKIQKLKPSNWNSSRILILAIFSFYAQSAFTGPLCPSNFTPDPHLPSESELRSKLQQEAFSTNFSKRSFARQQPQIAQFFINNLHRKSLVEVLIQNAIHQNLTYKSTLNSILVEFKALDQQIDSLLTTITESNSSKNSSYLSKNALALSSKRIKKIIVKLQSFIEEQQLSDTEWNMRKIESHINFSKFYADHFFVEEFRALIASFAEFAIFMTAPNSRNFAIPILEVFKTQASELLLSKIELKELSTQIQKNNLEGEIDVVFDNGQAWAEVKNLNVKVESIETNSSLYRQALRHIKNRNFLVNQGVQSKNRTQKLNDVKVHYIFIQGISPNAARVLQELGIIVHSGLPFLRP